jgi:hypothetical protein
VTPQEFLALWGGADMVHPPEDALVSMGAASASFLKEAGLPRRAGLQLDFSPVEQGLPSLRNVLSAKGLSIQAGWSGCRVLGQDNASYLCIEPGRDQVIAVWPRDKLQRFVNTSIPQLAECLLGYREMSKGSDHLRDEAYAEELRRYIHRVDNQALADEESWWSVVVEQASYGDV